MTKQATNADELEALGLPAMQRDLEVTDLEVTRSARGANAIQFSASSDLPAARAWGEEVLDHNPAAVRMDRINAGAVPLLFNHDWNDPVGMVTEGRLADGRLEAQAEFFDTKRADEVRAMIEGGLKNISIGYEIHALKERADGAFVATDWSPHEISVVTVPLDHSIGIGREVDQTFKRVRVERAESETAQTAASKREQTMPEENNGSAAAADTTNQQAAVEVRGQPKALDHIEVEKLRKRSISKLARANNISPEIENHWIETGADMNKVADDLLEILEERGKSADAPARLGMSKKEVREYSVLRAIRAALSNNWSKAGLELEAHRALESRDGLQTREERSFFVPMDVQAREPVYGTRQQRDFNVAGAGNLVGTDHLAGSFIELLRNQSVVMGSGATRLTGLRGNVSIPKMTAGSTAYWLASETTAITESQPTIGQLNLTPKNVAALTEISHQMLQQGDPSAEQLVLNDLAASVALAADLGALSGDGTGGAPTGITNTAGIGAFTGTAIDYAKVLDAQVDVVKANALLGSPGYICDPDTTAKLMTREKFSGSGNPIWVGNILNGDCAGMPGRTSNQMAADSALFGAWATLVLAEWGTLELAVNPNQNFAAGLTGLRAWYTMDVGLRYAAAFSLATTIT